jgi:hypothetical protein
VAGSREIPERQIGNENFNSRTQQLKLAQAKSVNTIGGLN